MREVGVDSMNLLVIDAGNSRCKVANGILDDAGPRIQFSRESIQSIPVGEIKDHLGQLDEVGLCVVASVNDEASIQIKEGLSSAHSNCDPVFLSPSNSTMELNVASALRVTLGPDRIAAAIGAYARSQSSTIVIDSGTATTVDFIDDKGVFQGGLILPGFQLALNSLAEHTDRLPQLKFDETDARVIVGRDTIEAMQSGVFWNLVGGVELIVSRIQQEFGPANVLVTGGNGQTILNASSLENTECVPSLVLEGLWQFGWMMAQKRLEP